MDRPATSKSRGVCCYYTTPRGCFAGDNCKFLHGADERLTPYDKSKVCRYYARGHCARGDRCWFRHVLLKVTPDDERIKFSAEICCICLEKPTTYGLLTGCSHVFCLECIRQWRAPAGKSPDVVSSGTVKRCPLCRTPSRFVTPSAHFFPNNSPQKKETIDAYKASMAKVACKYFEETSRTGKPCCPFGMDCFYGHINPDGTPYVFRHGAKHSMNVYRRHRFRDAGFSHAHFDYDDPIEFLQHIFENPLTNLHATLDVMRASFPAFMERFGTSNEPDSHSPDEDEDEDEDEEDMDEFIDAFELLENNSVTHDESAAAERNTVQFPLMEPTPEHAPLPTRLPLFPETRPTPQSQPARPSSRFSTVMDTQSQQTFIIDISDDEEEEEEESVQHTADTAPHLPLDSSGSPLSESVRIPQPLSEHQPATLQPVANTDVNVPLNRPQCEHDVDPPFMTDGRGRVVWSSTRNVSGRGTATDGRVTRHSRTGSTPRIACPSPSSAILVSSARGHVVGGQDTEGIDGKVGGGEESSNVD